MKILWINNIVFPEVQKILYGDNNNKLKSSGGWMLGAAEVLLSQPDINLSVATVSSEVKQLTHFKGEKITYWLLPLGKGNTHINHEYEPMWREINKVESPDIIHIHGTEFSHGLAYVEACGADRVCVSLQGVTSVIYNYCNGGLSKKEIIKATTLSTIRYGGILKTQRVFKKRAESEIRLLQMVMHVIGRTTFDRTAIWSINPKAVYHYCGETLRTDFYKGDIWIYDKCVPHSIFISQAGSPLKGFHQVLRAMPQVLRHYPDTIIRVAGHNVTDISSWKKRLLISNYGNLLNKIVRDNNLQEHISFTGKIDGNGMKQEYLRCNVFVCPSSIENSPNSLGEAQILGVPCIASYVGGIPDMMRGDEEHLYRYEDVDALAYKIVSLFEQNGFLNTEPMRQKALLRHDAETNLNTLMNIYKSIYV